MERSKSSTMLTTLKAFDLLANSHSQKRKDNYQVTSHLLTQKSRIAYMHLRRFQPMLLIANNFLLNFSTPILAKVLWDGRTHSSSTDDGSWLLLLPSLQDITPALSSSTLALCTAFVVRQHADEALVKQSLVFHGQALRSLQKALWDPHSMYQDETLAACFALAMYEQTECPSNSNHGWAKHMEGCAKLIKHRGPEAHSSNLGWRLLLWFRISGPMEAITHGQPTYLSDPEWCSVPFRNMDKSLLHQLIDITSQLASNFAQARALELSTPADIYHKCIGIISSCWEIEVSLRRFYADVEPSQADPLYWPKSADAYTAVNLANEPLFTVAFWFTNLYVAYIYMIYWSTSILLWLILSSMGRAFGNNFPSGFPLILSSLDILVLSHNICQSVPYFLQDGMGTLGSSLLAIPLVSVIETLKDVPGCDAEVSWAKAAMQIVSARGMHLMGAAEAS